MLNVFGKGALAAAIAAVTISGAFAQDGEPIRIGYSMSRTGLFSQAAPSQENAYELWREQVNAEGGLLIDGERRPVEFVAYDDQSNPGNAVRIYETLITQDQVDLLAAPWGTPFHLAIAPVLNRYKFPMVGNTAASVQLREVAPGYIWFPTSAIPDRMGEELAKFMKENDVESAAVLANELPFSQEIRSFLLPAMEAEGIELALDETYPPDINDLTAVLAQVRSAGPDAVIALSYPSDSFLFTTQARELGLDAPFVMALVGPTFASYRDAFGEGANSIVTLGHWSFKQDDWARARPFYDAYVEKFGEIPDALDSVLSYVSLEILQQAVEAVGLDKEAIREYISTETFETINGPIKFDGVENVITPTAYLQIQEGDLELVWPSSIATSEFQPKSGW